MTYRSGLVLSIKPITNNKYMKSAAAIPVLGRLPLIEQGIKRFVEKNKIDHVVCVCSNEQDMEYCKAFEPLYPGKVEVIFHPNEPLAQKWNAGWKHLMDNHDPDFYVFVGSSDWLSDNWLEMTIPFAEKFDAVGKLDMWLYDFGKTENRLCFWPGYVGERAGDSIGIGRILSRKIVRKMNGQPFHPSLNSGLDWSMTQHMKVYGVELHTIESKDIKSLSLSCYLWGQKHQFEQHWGNKLPSERLGHGTEFMNEYFPEYRQVNEQIRMGI